MVQIMSNEQAASEQAANGQRKHRPMQIGSPAVGTKDVVHKNDHQIVHQNVINGLRARRPPNVPAALWSDRVGVSNACRQAAAFCPPTCPPTATPPCGTTAITDWACPTWFANSRRGEGNPNWPPRRRRLLRSRSIRPTRHFAKKRGRIRERSRRPQNLRPRSPVSFATPRTDWRCRRRLAGRSSRTNPCRARNYR